MGADPCCTVPSWLLKVTEIPGCLAGSERVALQTLLEELDQCSLEEFERESGQHKVQAWPPDSIHKGCKPADKRKWVEGQALVSSCAMSHLWGLIRTFVSRFSYRFMKPLGPLLNLYDFIGSASHAPERCRAKFATFRKKACSAKRFASVTARVDPAQL